MIFLRLYRFFSGKVKVCVSGEFAERILNLCAHNGISVWGIRKKNGKITLFMSVRDFRAIRYVIRGSKLRLHILKKYGFPFIANRYKHRYGLFFGVMLFFFILYFLSGFVWNINISGNSTVSDKTIINACRQIGIKEGIKKSEIDALQKRVELLTKVDGLTWSAINIEGCVLTVDVTEAEEKEKNKNMPSNLVAADNGKIVKTEVISGQTKVKAGDFVAKGEVLVSGIYELKNGNTQLTRSSGEIYAEVEKTISVTVPLKQRINTLCGSSHKRYVLSFFGLKIPLYLGEFSQNYVRNDSIKTIKNGEFYIPIYLHCGEYMRIEENDITLTETEAVELAREQLSKRISDSEIIKAEERIDRNNDKITLKYFLKLKKDIAKEEILLISTTK